MLFRADRVLLLKSQAIQPCCFTHAIPYFMLLMLLIGLFLWSVSSVHIVLYTSEYQNCVLHFKISLHNSGVENWYSMIGRGSAWLSTTACMSPSPATSSTAGPTCWRSCYLLRWPLPRRRTKSSDRSATSFLYVYMYIGSQHIITRAVDPHSFLSGSGSSFSAQCGSGSCIK